MSFLGEIKRRKVFQVAAVYLVVSWLIMQVVDVVNEPLNLPDWFDTAVIVALAIGLPIALILAWAFDVTPDGVVKDQGGHDAVHSGGKRIEYVLIGLVVIALTWVIYRVEFDSGGVAGVQREGVLRNSIAVLPFENLSPDPNNAYFAAGIHESTLNQLAKIRDLIVISRTTVMQYEEDRPSIPEIAKALNVTTIMEGSVRYASGRVLITAQLIDGETDAHLWSKEFNRDLTDVFAVQAEVAEQIALAMQVELLPDEQARIDIRPTESTEAYQHYLHALSLPYPSVFSEYLPTYIESLDRAIAADPEFADAYMELAWGYFWRGDRDIAVETALRAIGLDPAVGGAYALLGYVYGYYYVRQEDARDALDRAVELSPNDPTTLIDHAYRIGEQSGDYAEAIRNGKRAVTIDPNSASFHQQLGFIFLRAGDTAEAARNLRKAIRLDPRFYVAYVNLASVEYLNGDRSAAKENLDRAVQVMSSGATNRVDYLVYLYGLLGEPDQAAEQLARLDALLDDPQIEDWQRSGWSVLGTRDRKRALKHWTTTVNGYLQENQPVSVGRITRFRDNWLNDPILEEPKFLELRRRLGFKG